MDVEYRNINLVCNGRRTVAVYVNDRLAGKVEDDPDEGFRTFSGNTKSGWSLIGTNPKIAKAIDDVVQDWVDKQPDE